MRTAFQVPNALAPADGVGPLYLPVLLDFRSVSTITFDLLEEQSGGVFDKAQSLYVENKNNLNPLILHFAGTDYELTVPAGAGGIFPVFTNGITQCVASTPVAASLQIQIAFVNVPMPLTQWGPITVNIAAVTATFEPTPMTLSDFSGNAGASAQVFPANAAALFRTVQNPATNINSIFLNFGGVAATDAGGSIEIPPGQSFTTGNTIDQTQWMIYAAAATPFTAKQGT